MHYYHYQGGLTTPTCNEAVLWTNFMSMQTISEAQLAIFRTMTDSDSVSIVDNYRPPQPLNAPGGSTTAAESSIITDIINTGFTALVVTGIVDCSNHFSRHLLHSRGQARLLPGR